MRRVVFTTWPLLSATKKYVLPAHYGNNFIYQFVCYWDSRYVGRTSQNLQERIKQHVPRPIRNHHSSKNGSNFSRACKRPQIIAIVSTIRQHLLENISCASQYSDAKFSILARGRTSFYLSTLELNFIKSFQSNLCRYNEFLYSLKVIH